MKIPRFDLSWWSACSVLQRVTRVPRGGSEALQPSAPVPWSDVWTTAICKLGRKRGGLVKCNPPLPTGTAWRWPTPRPPDATLGICANKIIPGYDLIGHIIGKGMILLERCLMDSQRSPHVRETSKGVQPKGGSKGGYLVWCVLLVLKWLTCRVCRRSPRPVAISYPGPLN